MVHKIILVALVVLQFAKAQPAYKEVYTITNRQGDKITRLMPVLVRAYPVAVDSNRIKVYYLVDVQYDFLQFTLQNTKYMANWETEVNLADEKNNAVSSTIREDTLFLNDFKSTNRRDRYILSVDSQVVKPGRYLLQFKYSDLQGRQKLAYNLRLNLLTSPPLYAAPPLLTDPSGTDAKSENLFGNRVLALRQTIPFNTGRGVYLHCTVPADDTVRVRLTLGQETREGTRARIDTVLTSKGDFADATIRLPLKKFAPGTYQLSVVYHWGEDSLIQKMPVDIVWFSRPRSLQNIDYAIKTLQILLPEKQFEALDSGNKKEKEEALYKFWNAKDPTPATAYNEIMTEFYQRVDSADVEWGRKRLYGWRRDIGRIYVLYGTPHEVNDQSLNPDNPRLQWVYNLPDKRLVFTFRAVDGRKKYELIDEKEESLQ